jgi:hypothetical protein
MLRYRGYKLLCIGRDVVRVYVATGAKVEFVHLVATLRASINSIVSLTMIPHGSASLLHQVPSTDELNIATPDTLATPRVSEYEPVEVLAADFVLFMLFMSVIS